MRENERERGRERESKHTLANFSLITPFSGILEKFSEKEKNMLMSNCTQRNIYQLLLQQITNLTIKDGYTFMF